MVEFVSYEHRVQMLQLLYVLYLLDVRQELYQPVPKIYFYEFKKKAIFLKENTFCELLILNRAFDVRPTITFRN
jgi:hypothetical protein